MKRRDSLKLFGGLLASSLLTGCVSAPHLTNKLFQEETYEETFTNVYLTTDDKKLIVMTKKYHYIFDVSYALLVALKTELHSAINGLLSDMHIDGDNNASLAIELNVKADATAIQRSLAVGAGFKPRSDSNPQLRYKQELAGVRYLAGNFKVPANALSLNKPYSIKVHAQLNPGQKAARMLVTPITLTADGAILLGTVAVYAVMIPVILLFSNWDH